MTQVITKLVDQAADQAGLVAVTGIDTVPERDLFVGLSGHATQTRLRVDPAERSAYVYQAQQTGSTLMSVWRGVDLEYAVAGYPDGDVLRDYLAHGDGQALLRRICDGHNVEWDGDNWVGRMTADALAATEALENDLDAFESRYAFWPASDWLHADAETLVSADTSDDELAVIAADFAAATEEEDVVLDEDIMEWLTRYRAGLPA